MKEETQNSIFNSNVKWLVSIAVFVVGVVGPYFTMRQDIALIQKDISNINSNHEAHIQDILQNIKDMKVMEQNQQAQIIELQKQLITLANKR